MVSVISTLMLDVSHAIEVLVLCLPLEVQDSIQQLHFEYSNTCLQSCLIRNTYTSITSAWCVRSSYCFLSGTTCVLVTVQYITTSPLLLSTLYNISWHLRLNNSFLGCRLRFRRATNFNLSLKLSCNLSVFMLFTKLYDLVLSSSFYSSTASTAQHSTAQHSTAQHSAIIPAQSSNPSTCRWEHKSKQVYTYVLHTCGVRVVFLEHGALLAFFKSPVCTLVKRWNHLLHSSLRSILPCTFFLLWDSVVPAPFFGVGEERCQYLLSALATN